MRFSHAPERFFSRAAAIRLGLTGRARLVSGAENAINGNAMTSSYSGPDLCRQTAFETVAELKSGKVTPNELLDACFERMGQVDDAVNAIPTKCLERARDRLAGFAPHGSNSGAAGWLAGLPVAIKDLTAVSGVRSTWGTPALADFAPDFSDYCVERIEDMGGVVVGKSNTPEMGAGANTFNEVLGTTRNPWNVACNAGGSSGGSAVALATGQVWLAHGSDLAGSLRTPAAYCGVVGLRPTPGRITHGPSDVPFATEGVQGPMARTVLDTALFLDAMSGFDPRDPISIEAPADSFQSAVLRADQKVRVAWSEDLNGLAPVEANVIDPLKAALTALEKSGGTVEEACPDLPDLVDTYVTLRAMAWASGPGRLPAAVQEHFKQTLAWNIDLGRKLTPDQIYDALRGRGVLFRKMLDFLGNYDVLACPIVGISPTPVEMEYPTEVNGQPVGDYVEWLRFSFLSTTTALPSISVPAGFDGNGMPVGLQLIGPPRGEARLLAVAAAVERAVGFAGQAPIDPKG